MSTKCHKPDLNVISGALEGINNYLYNFTQSAQESSEHSWDIFNYTKQALLSNHNIDELNRYAMPRAALNLFERHAEQFDEFIYDDYRDLFDRLSNWAQHKNYDMKKLAYMALDSYYKQLAEMLKKKAKSESDKCKKIFRFFVEKFYKNLTNDLDLKETVIAIKGFGAFAGPCKEFMEPKDVKQMFNIIIEICERTFFLNQSEEKQIGSQNAEIFDEKVYQLPSFIESIAYVCDQIDGNLPEGSLLTMEKLVILAIDSYPKLIKRYNYQISLAVVRLFISIQLEKGSFYTEFISRIVYQSLVRIFSYRTSYFMQQDSLDRRKQTDEDEMQEEIKKNIYNITSLDYVMLWSNLLNLTEFKELNTIGITISARKKLVAIIYDEYIEATLKIMRKLDLNAVKTEGETETNSNHNELNVSSNPIAGLKPLKPRDFEILVNLVDFSR
jgi:DNA-dependent protein kinase catalytic subunit